MNRERNPFGQVFGTEGHGTMKSWRKLSALFAAGALVVALSGIASAASVEPIVHEGNIQMPNDGGPHDKAACDQEDAIFFGGDEEGDNTSDNGVTVTVTHNDGDKGFDFVATGGVVLIAYVKGGPNYHEYNYGAGVAWDNDLYAPDNAGLSHIIFCTAETEETTTEETTTEETTSEETTSEETTTEETTTEETTSEETTTEETTTEETTTEETTSEETTTEETTTEETTTEETTFTQSTAGETDVPSQPPTTMVGGGPSGPSESSWLLVALLGAFLAGAVILTPARAKSQR
jgi:hypothetical protein